MTTDIQVIYPRETHLVKAMVFPVVMYRGEGNGNTLQYSCLENPKDGGAWWAVVYGVAEQDTTEATQQQQQQLFFAVLQTIPKLSGLKL